MRFVFAFLAAFVLMLSVTNAAVANAAATSEPTAVEMLSHFEGDGDEVPDCPRGAGGMHHHSTLGEHQIAVPQMDLALNVAPSEASKLTISADDERQGLHPAFEPHPPKA